ncbi:hypothetical protein PHYPSEUDO_006863 [Phytophthora pseudosyringae]|uniref:RxLR effector protein n=1 Tax=Phytophthora pseudosyringae TaxID=221518 RepID=A0A8T1WEJ2_9STRA|nr:hypothetical protein PHYPSEUDO_006863 [Phytophthora pseudosyringae]
MRVLLLLLLAVLALVASSSATSASTVTQQDSQHLTSAALGSGRMLRTEATTARATNPDGEERGVMDIIKKLPTRSKTWIRDKTLTAKLHAKAMSMNLDSAVKELVKNGVNPDRVYTLLRLDKADNVNVGNFQTGEYRLWEKLNTEWKAKHLNWVSKIHTT